MQESEATSFNGLPDRGQQHAVIKRFRQEFDSPRLHGLDCFRYIAITRNEDDGQICPFNGNPLLQLETVEARKREVEYETAWNKRSWSIEEFPGGRESFWLPALALDKEFQRLSHRDVVVNNEHDGRTSRHWQ